MKIIHLSKHNSFKTVCGIDWTATKDERTFDKNRVNCQKCKVQKPPSKKEIERFILGKVNEYTIVTTWWMSDFYEEFCNFTGADFENRESTSRKIRYRLNALVKKGLLEKRNVGSGFLGKTDFGSTHYGAWALKGYWL